MFRHLRNKKKNEYRKLFYQNNSALPVVMSDLKHKGDLQALSSLETYVSEQDRIYMTFNKTGKVSLADIKMALHINSYLRNLYELRSEVRVYTRMKNALGTSPGRPPATFDETFQPTLGWQAFYADS